MPAKIGEVVVDLIARSGEFVKGFNDADSKLQQSAASMRRVGAGLTVGLTAPIVGVAAAAFKMAADSAEAAAKLEAVFGPATAEVNAKIAELRDTVPATTDELQKMYAGVQDLLVPLGQTPDAAAKMTDEVVRLSADLASFNNIPVEEALRKIQSGLVGQYEPLLQFGVALNKSTVEAKALELGLIAEGEALDANARAQASFQLILENTSAAHGDAARTAGSSANQLKFLGSEVRELAGFIGAQLLPVITPVIEMLVDWARKIQTLDPRIVRFGIVIAGAAAALGPLLVALGSLPVLLPAIGAAFAAITGPIGLVYGAIVGLTAVWFAFGDDIKRITARAIAFVIGKFADLLEFIANVYGRLPFNLGAIHEKALSSASDWAREMEARLNTVGVKTEDLADVAEVALAEEIPAAAAATGQAYSMMERQVVESTDALTAALDDLAAQYEIVNVRNAEGVIVGQAYASEVANLGSAFRHGLRVPVVETIEVLDDAADPDRPNRMRTQWSGALEALAGEAGFGGLLSSVRSAIGALTPPLGLAAAFTTLLPIGKKLLDLVQGFGRVEYFTPEQLAQLKEGNRLMSQAIALREQIEGPGSGGVGPPVIGTPGDEAGADPTDPRNPNRNSVEVSVTEFDTPLSLAGSRTSRVVDGDDGVGE